MCSVDLLGCYLNNPANAFSILILGERGTGKTRGVKKIAEELKKKVVVINCASFSDDTMAESELFGHKKGAFTGAIEEKAGLFEEAKNGILFFDEIHNLSSRVQEKLMTALQTESSGVNKGKFCIRRLGDNKDNHVEFRPVFASNLTLPELKEKILPDFYDRISQLVLEFPSIHQSKLNVNDEFKKVWEEMQFQEHNTPPRLKKFRNWLNRIPLEGNYRTLQSIAINWHQGMLMCKENNETEAFNFVKTQFEKYHSPTLLDTMAPNWNFRKGASWRTLRDEYKKAMYDWGISEDGYGSVKAAQKGLSYVRMNNPHKRK